MSAALAVAATSEVLRYLVSDAITRAGQDLGFTAPAVSTGAPPKPVQNTGADAPAVNLFLHMATPNAAWRNLQGPARDAQGRRLHNAPLILDLHYLLSAHGPEAIREIALATAMHALHQAGIVPRDLVRAALKKLESSADPNKKALAVSRLADQVESLTISSEALDIDAMTKIWTATQAPYRPSAGYLVTTVFLEDMRPARAPLPVTGGSGVSPVSLKELMITRVEGRKGGTPWPLSTDTDIYVEGAGFADSSLAAKLGSGALAPDPANSGPATLLLRMPLGTIAALRAGPQVLELTLSAEVGGRAMPVQSVAAVVTLHPAVSVPNQVVADTPGDPTTVTGTLTLNVSPPVERRQSAMLLLAPASGSGAEQGAAWKPPPEPAPPAPPVNTFTALDFQLKRVPKGEYIVRLIVDATASQPMPDGTGRFGPRVTL